MAEFKPSRNFSEKALRVSSSFSDEVTYRLYAIGNDAHNDDAKAELARHLLGFRIIVQISNLASRVALKKDSQEFCLADLGKREFDSRLASTFAAYLAVPADGMAFRELLAELADELADWIIAPQNEDEVHELGLDVTGQRRTITLKCNTKAARDTHDVEPACAQLVSADS